MKLIAFKYGDTDIQQRMAFLDGDESIRLPISLLFFLIEQGDRKILIDVGCDTMPGFNLYKFKKPVEVLRDYGVNPGEITDVVISHAHHDHIDAIRHYKNADVYIHKYELGDAKEYLPQGADIYALNGDFELMHGVLIKHIGGHSKGSCVVLIDGKEKTYVLCGDECYTMENILKCKSTGATCDMAKSTAFVKEYSKDFYIPILSHSPGLQDEIGHKVLYSD